MAITVTPVKSYMQAEYLVENPDGGPERPYRKQKRNILAVDPAVPVADRDAAHAAAEPDEEQYDGEMDPDHGSTL